MPLDPIGFPSACSSVRNKPRLMKMRASDSTMDTPTRCTCSDTSLAVNRAAAKPPTTVPRLQRPCSRFMIGAWRRPLNHEPCRFMETSTMTSSAAMKPSAITNTAGVVANPISGRVSTSRHAPPISDTRVPNRSRIRAEARLPARPMTRAVVISAPSTPVDTPMRSRISGSLGMNEAKIAPFTKNCTATDAVARRSRAPNDTPGTIVPQQEILCRFNVLGPDRFIASAHQQGQRAQLVESSLSSGSRLGCQACN